jgi:hypothetical protein
MAFQPIMSPRTLEFNKLLESFHALKIIFGFVTILIFLFQDFNGDPLSIKCLIVLYHSFILNVFFRKCV